VKKITILGAGPASLWTALYLLKKSNQFDITIIEKDTNPGGITGSFSFKDMTFDYGSHRLHPSTDEAILQNIKTLLKGDLLKRPRNGRILLEGQFISFPLKPLDLLFNLPLSFSFGVAIDSIVSIFKRRVKGKSFEDTLLAGLGKTISERFYFPYAKKLWGLPPDQLSPVQARKRIASGSIGKMVRKALASLTGASKETGIFYYPKHGFGQIAEFTTKEIERLGAHILFGESVTSVTPPSATKMGLVETSTGKSIEADFIFSTIPITKFIKALRPSVPNNIAKASSDLSFRAMVFCIVELDSSQYTPYDAHYFPGVDTCFSRMSEPKNYSLATDPKDRTGLCFEIPCSEGDKIWKLEDKSLLKIVLDDLRKTNLPVPIVTDFTIRRKTNVYPIYDHAFEARVNLIEEYLKDINKTISLGRQGLFVHDNTHHTIEMGIAAADCLSENLHWNEAKWSNYRKLFDSHVVVD